MGPYEVMIFSVEEVLLDIYDGDLSKVETDSATIAFFDWLEEHDAHYYSNSLAEEKEVVFEAVLDAIKKGKQIVVLPALPDKA